MEAIAVFESSDLISLLLSALTIFDYPIVPVCNPDCCLTEYAAQGPDVDAWLDLKGGTFQKLVFSSVTFRSPYNTFQCLDQSFELDVRTISASSMGIIRCDTFSLTNNSFKVT